MPKSKPSHKPSDEEKAKKTKLANLKLKSESEMKIKALLEDYKTKGSETKVLEPDEWTMIHCVGSRTDDIYVDFSIDRRPYEMPNQPYERNPLEDLTLQGNRSCKFDGKPFSTEKQMTDSFATNAERFKQGFESVWNKIESTRYYPCDGRHRFYFRANVTLSNLRVNAMSLEDVGRYKAIMQYQENYDASQKDEVTRDASVMVEYQVDISDKYVKELK